MTLVRRHYGWMREARSAQAILETVVASFWPTGRAGDLVFFSGCAT